MGSREHQIRRYQSTSGMPSNPAATDIDLPYCIPRRATCSAGIAMRTVFELVPERSSFVMSPEMQLTSLIISSILR